jgi:hypothetical protein
MTIQRLFKKTKGKKCGICKGLGFKWGWRTLYITLPLSLIELFVELIPKTVFVFLLWVGICVDLGKFEYPFYVLSTLIVLPFIWFEIKRKSPECPNCSCSGQPDGDV